MKLDVTPVAGFPLQLDTDTMAIMAGDEICFGREVRGKAQMQNVLMNPEAIPADAELYYNFKLISAGRYASVFDRHNLTFGCVLLPPLKIGSEFVKTHGHYHPAMPGISLSYPEVYTHYCGSLYLLMQRRANADPAHLDDCVLYEMTPGQSIMIPPGYFHILINPSNQPALMAGLYCPDSYPEYEPVVQMRGAAYYLVDEAGGVRVVENPRYPAAPRLVTLGDLKATSFEPPCAGPLWSSFVEEPEAYAMLSDPYSAQALFRR